MTCAPQPRPARRRDVRWPAVCTAVRRRLMRVVLGRRPFVLVEVDPHPPVSIRIRSGGGVDTPNQLTAVLLAAVDAIEGKEADRA